MYFEKEKNKVKLSISNIAWSDKYDKEMYQFLYKNQIEGIEIAPTRIFSENPYDKLKEAKEFAKHLKEEYNLEISSMQSIWFGRKENIFNSTEERKNLIEYTKKAIDFASEIKCNNLVFGCPKNRNIEERDICVEKISNEFFKEISEYAEKRGTIIAIEPNPTIYGTNFINTTHEAFELAQKINSKGLKVNVDIGTVIQNKENIFELVNNIKFINHIHISEPNLEIIEKRDLHKDLKNILIESKYDRFVSIEMKNKENLENVKSVIEYVKGIFK